MGCGMVSSQTTQSNILIPKLKSLESQTKVGSLRIKIKKAKLRMVEERMEKLENLFLKIRLGEEQKYIPLKNNCNEKEEGIHFAINSCYRPYGRFLSIQLWSHVPKNFKEIGFGISALDSLLDPSCPQITVCNLNYETSPAGSLTLFTQFLETNYQNLSLKLRSKLFRVGNKSKGKITAKVIIGEEAFFTEQAEVIDSIKWEQNTFTFRVPEKIERGVIKLVQKVGSSDIFLTEILLNLNFLLQAEKQINITEQVHINEKVSGIIEISSLKGMKKSTDFLHLRSCLQMQTSSSSNKHIQNSIPLSTKSTKESGGGTQKDVNQHQAIIPTEAPVKLMDIERIYMKTSLRRKKSQNY